MAGIDMGLGSIFGLISFAACFTLLENAVLCVYAPEAGFTLLRKVSLANSAHASRMVSGHFHCRVTLVLDMTTRLVAENLDFIRSTCVLQRRGSKVMSLEPSSDAPLGVRCGRSALDGRQYV